jgi:hypothetical protein
VVGLVQGGFVVTWGSSGQDGSGYGVYGQRFNAMGTPRGSEFRVNTFTTGDQNFPSIAALTGGGFVITWASNGQDGSGFGVYGQHYNPKGVPVGAEFPVNTYTANDQSHPSVAGLSNGGFVVTWDSFGQETGKMSVEDGVYSQLFSATGARVGIEFHVNSNTEFDQSHPSVATLIGGDFFITFNNENPGGHSKYNIVGRRYAP